MAEKSYGGEVGAGGFQPPPASNESQPLAPPPYEPGPTMAKASYQPPPPQPQPQQPQGKAILGTLG